MQTASYTSGNIKPLFEFYIGTDYYKFCADFSFNLGFFNIVELSFKRNTGEIF